MSTLRFDAAGVIDATDGLSKEQINGLAGQLDRLRADLIVAADGEHRDDGFFLLPQQQLAAYEAHRHESELGRIFKLANSIHDEIDAVVVLGDCESSMAVRAIMQACCDPYHNELSRGGRGSKPRMYFGGDSLDNDGTAALISRLVTGGYGESSAERRYAIVVINKSGETLETAVAFRQILAGLECSLGVDVKDRIQRLVIPVTGGGRLHAVASEIGCEQIFGIPDRIDSQYNVLSAVGLLPAALLGLDCIRLLQGAIAMSEHFKTTPFSENVVLQYVAVNHLVAQHPGETIRVMKFWNRSLESVGHWYAQLLTRSTGGLMPQIVDAHGGSAWHPQAGRDQVFHNVVVEDCCHDRVGVGNRPCDQDALNALADKTLPELMESAISRANESRNADGRPTANLRLPRIDTYVLGQLFQMLMIATVIEARLMGLNPYGPRGAQ